MLHPGVRIPLLPPLNIMKTVGEQIESIRAMPQNIRLAGYIRRSAQTIEHLSKLRLEKEDDEWTEVETAEWEKLVDEEEPWWYALSEEEHTFLNPICLRAAILANGEDINSPCSAFYRGKIE